MVITPAITKRLKEMEEREELKKSGKQLRYRVRYSATAWFLPYTLEEFFYRESVVPDGQSCDIIHSKGWVKVKKFRSEADARKVVDELERINGVLAEMPDWYRKENEH